MCERPSYLQAVQSDVHLPSNLKRKRLLSAFNKVEDMSIKNGNTMKTKEQILQVYLRIKSTCIHPCYNVIGNTLECLVPPSSEWARNAGKNHELSKSYTFASIFDSDSGQNEVFEFAVKSRALNFLNGHNNNVLAFGASGSGKTYTMVGTSNEPGIIPRSLEYVFRVLPALPDSPKAKPNNNMVQLLNDNESLTEKNVFRQIVENGLTRETQNNCLKVYQSMKATISNDETSITELPDVFGIWISVAEIYNENICDLLVTNGNKRPGLKLMNNNGEPFIAGLRSVYVRSGLEAYLLLQCGLNHLRYAETCVNSHSSRSHCIFTMTLIQANESSPDINHVNRLNFCDLAGSERLRKTNNVGDRFKESLNINKSLLVLHRCIKLLTEDKVKTSVPFLPIRESNLTKYFQNALTGKEQLCMLVNINSDIDVFDESIHALNFSAVAQKLTFKIKEEKPETLFSQFIKNQACFSNNTIIEDLESKVFQLNEQILDLQEEKEMSESQLRAELSAKFITIYRENEKRLCQDLQNTISCLRTENMELRREINRLKFENTFDESSVIIIDSDEEDRENEESNSERENESSEKSTMPHLLQISNNSPLTTSSPAILNKSKDRLSRNSRTILSSQEAKVILGEYSELKKSLDDAKTEYMKKSDECEELRRKLFTYQEQIEMHGIIID